MYEGCKLTPRESRLIIMSMALRNGLTDEGLEMLIRVIDCHLPSREHISKYRFLKGCSNIPSHVHFFCPQCFIALNFEGASTVQCNNCEVEFNERQLMKGYHFFYYIPLKSQLIDLIKSELYMQFRKSCDNESDVIDGKVYKQLRSANVISNSDISIQWNTDGVELFNSSNYSMWPIQVCVNELPYRLRRANSLLCGLWYNKTKPPMDLFLRPFVDELIELHDIGFQCTTFNSEEIITVRVHAFLSPVDSVARPLIVNMRQFNGKYGCTYCLHKGEEVKVGRGSAHVYPGGKGKKRTLSRHEVHIEKNIQTGKVVKGVKGPCVIMMIPLMDPIYSFPPEYMHSCLLGVTKLFASAWFDSSNHSREWYLGTKISQFNEKLIAMQPPCEVTRTPQQIKFSKLKANDLKYFLLYYSLICLTDLMPKKFIKHWMLFVYSIYTFSKSKITEDEFVSADEALILFVDKIEDLYGKEYMKYNVHVLRHIPDFVKKFGALWAWSAFPFEHFNGVIGKLHHGTQCIPSQICKMYSRLRYVKQEAQIFNDPNCSMEGKMLFQSIMKQCRISKCIEFKESLKIFGKPIDFLLSTSQKVLIELVLQDSVEENVKSFQRFISNNILFHGSKYSRLSKRNNSTVLLKNGSIMVITYLISVTLPDSESSTYVVFGKELRILNEELCKYANISSNRFSFVAVKTNNDIACLVHEIDKKCVNVIYKDKLYIIPIVNTVETD